MTLVNIQVFNVNIIIQIIDNKLYKISFMIFRTGSILIVGKCDDDILNIIYEYIKNLLIKEYDMINVKNTANC